MLNAVPMIVSLPNESAGEVPPASIFPELVKLEQLRIPVVIEFVPLPNTPLLVIAPHVIEFVPLLKAPLLVIAPHETVPDKIALVPENTVPDTGPEDTTPLLAFNCPPLILFVPALIAPVVVIVVDESAPHVNAFVPHDIVPVLVIPTALSVPLAVTVVVVSAPCVTGLVPALIDKVVAAPVSVSVLSVVAPAVSVFVPAVTAPVEVIPAALRVPLSASELHETPPSALAPLTDKLLIVAPTH